MSPRWSDEVFEGILARVQAGERSRHILSEPGMPNPRYLFEHRKRNPDFARRWAAAQGRRQGARVGKAEFDRVLIRLRRGERLTAICREPGMPSYEAVMMRRRRDVVFAARFAEAIGRSSRYRVSQAEIDRVRERVALGERIVAVCAEPGMPSYNAVKGYRKRHPDQEAAWATAMGSRRGAFVDRQPERINAFLNAAKAGTDTGKLDRLIGGKSQHRLRRVDPLFAARYDEARTAGRIVIVRAASARKLSPTEAWTVVESAVRHVPPYARDDIRGDLMVALLEGKVAPENARAATRDLVTAWNRQFARRDISMDAEMGEDGDGFTFGALISDGTFDATGTGIRVRERAR